MKEAAELKTAAQQALEALLAAGFEHAQVTALDAGLTELNANDNEPSLLRSSETRKLTLLGIVEGRMASTELATHAPHEVMRAARALFEDAQAAPQDPAQAVSTGQGAELVHGPQAPDHEALVEALANLLAYRARSAPRFMLSEAVAAHRLQRMHVLTTGGSDIAASNGWYELAAIGSAREGSKSSSMNDAVGYTHDLRCAPVDALFGIGAMMLDTQKQIETRAFGEKFTGDVVLSPNAAASLLGWLLGQVGDAQLIAGSSLYRERVGATVASALLTVRSHFAAPGVLPLSGDAFLTPAVTLVENGRLNTLAPTLYGSRKTSLPHVPTAGGWEIAAGTTPLPDLIGGVARGALVGRLSMGMPAANGDFSAVIKNSFAIGKGEIGPALSEVMVTGNMAQMLRDIVAVSTEVQDGAGLRLPWLRVANLHFS